MSTIYYDAVNECFYDDTSLEEEEESPINSIIYREMEYLFETISENKNELFLDHYMEICDITKHI